MLLGLDAGFWGGGEPTYLEDSLTILERATSGSL